MASHGVAAVVSRRLCSSGKTDRKTGLSPWMAVGAVSRHVELPYSYISFGALFSAPLSGIGCVDAATRRGVHSGTPTQRTGNWFSGLRLVASRVDATLPGAAMVGGTLLVCVSRC